MPSEKRLIPWKRQNMCVLFLDEMEIAEGIEHEQSQDCFLGSVTYPPRDDAPNCALVFTQGGLTTR